MTESVGIYFHIPWCRSICTYCDFDRQAHAFELIPEYVEALVTDIGRQPALEVHSIYFGGGTPSLLTARQVRKVLAACRSRFRLLVDAEVTLEANPGDLDAARVKAFVVAGVNRISLGVQSLDDGMLRLLGRRHDARGAEHAAREARAGGIQNLSLDLMYGLPGQSPAHWRETLRRALVLRPEHISAYLLTIDDRVPLGRQVSRGRLSLPDDEPVSEMYRDLQGLMAKHDYHQYEISNWARSGFTSRHNLTYWRDEPYLGFGAGAASSFGGRRFKNTTDPAAYIAAVRSGVPELAEDELTARLTAVQDHLALGLRLREGLSLDRFERRFGRRFCDLAGAELNSLAKAGVLELDADRLRIADNYLLVSNEVILRLHEAVGRNWWQAEDDDLLGAQVRASTPDEL